MGIPGFGLPMELVIPLRSFLPTIERRISARIRLSRKQANAMPKVKVSQGPGILPMQYLLPLLLYFVCLSTVCYGHTPCVSGAIDSALGDIIGKSEARDESILVKGQDSQSIHILCLSKVLTATPFTSFYAQRSQACQRCGVRFLPTPCLNLKYT